MPLTKTLLPLLLTLLLITHSYADLSQPSQQAKALIQTLSLQEADNASRDHPRWQPPTQVVIAIPPQLQAMAKPMADSLQQAAPELTINTYVIDPKQPAPGFLKEAQVVFGSCSKTLFEQLPNLVWIQNYSSGVEHCVASVSDEDLIVTNIRRLAAPAIAEHAIALTMMLSRNLHTYHRQQLQSNWRRPSLSGGNDELSGKTMLVLGLGGIGSEVAKRAHGLGMRVIATRNSSRNGPDYVARVGLTDEMYDLAQQADVVVNALPLTGKTNNLIDRKFFSALKKGSYYISVGRGKTTNLDTMIKALNTGQLAGAGLDVTDPEPLPGDHPLWAMDNVIITPHVAGYSMAGIQRSFILYQENLRRYIRGEKLLNVVDIERGY